MSTKKTNCMNTSKRNLTQNLTQENLTWLRKGNLKKETDSSTKQRHKDYVKSRIDKTQQNSQM